MFIQRTAVALARQAAMRPVAIRAFSTSFVRRQVSADTVLTAPSSGKNISRKFEDIKSEEDLLPEGAQVGTVPTDLEQATGLERFEILGKMEGIDVFDMKPLPSDRLGTLEDPIMVRSAGEEQYLGCTGSPADSHVVLWLTISRDRPLGRCPECGSCYMMEYVGPSEEDHGHGHEEHGHDDHGHHKYEEPKSFADFVKPEYYYR